MIFKKKAITCPLTYHSVPLSTEIEDLSFIVFDTETTGFNVGADDRLLEIGAVPIVRCNVHENDSFQTFVNPNRQISREIIELTSITTENVEKAPEALTAIARLFDYVESYEAVCLIGHYVRFDQLVFKQELKRGKLAVKGMHALDTLDLIGYLAPSNEIRDLERYAMMFGTRIYERHHALGDARTTAYLFVELLRLLKQRGILTWGDLLRVTH